MSSRHEFPDANCQVTLAGGAAKSLPYLNITICEKCKEKCDKQVINCLNMLDGFLELPNYYMYTFLKKK
jgi:hypothetical protein